MDFLGLRNLTVMKNAVNEIRRTEKSDFELARIPEDDQATFEMLGRGETSGVFQLESDGMKRVLMDMKPSCLDDIIAVVAMYRPGPMEWIPQFISNKHGRTKPTYLHPALEPILEETYGIALYQEQVMKIARDIAGFTMGQADELRKVRGRSRKIKSGLPSEVHRRCRRDQRHRSETCRCHLRLRRAVRRLTVLIKAMPRHMGGSRIKRRIESYVSGAIFCGLNGIGPR